MTERPGDRTKEINGGSAALYLVRAPRVPFFMYIFIGLEAKGFLTSRGNVGSLSLYGGTFGRS